MTVGFRVGDAEIAAVTGVSESIDPLMYPIPDLPLC